jgi:proline dehydrogenase
MHGNQACDFLSEQQSTFISKLVFRLVRKHIAGATMNSALELTKELNSKGITTTITFLNDQITDSAKARYNLNSYIQLTKQISRLNLKSSVSVRLTQLGLNLPNGIVDSNMERLIEAAKPLKVHLWIEYEDGIDIGRLADKYIRYSQGYQGMGMELPLRHQNAESVLQRIGQRRMLKITTHYYRGKVEKATKSKDPRDPMALYISYIKRLVKGKHLIYILESDERSAYKIAGSAQGYKRNLIFELPLGYSKKWQNRLMKKKVGIDVYVPYGKDWTHYAINKLAEGRIRSIAATVLDGKERKRE